MEYRTTQEIQHVADIFPHPRTNGMPRSERLRRWAELLTRDPERELGTLIGTEFATREQRSRMRKSSACTATVHLA